ncbi:galactonate dehydratase [Luteitalea sp. TBR-22]|uniref:mandelate racemase/muconate lactonizing enzyme family protein n=1 Tax=Luteitalea sp. TBR-22 TaxID=2802971 RepID=UPI001AFCA332|nr:mandelate racemase/muconate lactonizing enzyme family protein [Luteitalea sp. TBR-22]BCS31878.1 galactonate dehydratase [Luteitalea sp. TBR-22]
MRWGAAAVAATAGLGAPGRGAVAASTAAQDASPPVDPARIAAAAAGPILRRELFTSPVTIASVELLKAGDQYLVRVRSREGATGLAVAHPEVLETTWPILTRRVAPFFVGKDARDLEALIDGVYLADSNYKWQGLSFWVPVASVEFAVLDLLGQVARQPIGELLGGVRRRDIAVYRASGNRGNSPEAELAYLQRLVEEIGARAIKFRLGARMRYDEASTRRDLALIPLTRKAFGDAMAIHADANGSYDVPTALRIGALMRDHGLAFLEEPVPFDSYDETRAIADALPLPVAGGEQESSLRRFRWMIEHRGVDVVQPDLFYFGGLIRSIRVARMAAVAGMPCTPHMSGGGLGYLYVAHFASCVPNAGPFQEYKGREDDLPVSSETSSLRCVNGVLTVPTGPGLGVSLDPAFLARAVPVA